MVEIIIGAEKRNDNFPETFWAIFAKIYYIFNSPENQSVKTLKKCNRYETKRISAKKHRKNPA